MMTTDLERASAVIVGIHRFFTDWISGTCAKESDLLAGGVGRHMAHDFVGIMANGAVITPATFEGWMDAVHGVSPSFRIAIREVAVRQRIGEALVVTCQEWQHDAPEPPRRSGRTSTMFLRDRRDRLEIAHLQETWLPDEVVQAGAFDF